MYCPKIQKNITSIKNISSLHISEKDVSLCATTLARRVSQWWCVGWLPLTDSSPLPNIIAVSTHSVFNEGIVSCKTDGYHGKNIKQGEMGPHDQ